MGVSVSKGAKLCLTLPTVSHMIQVFLDSVAIDHTAALVHVLISNHRNH